MEADINRLVLEEMRHAFYPAPFFKQRLKEELSRCHRYDEQGCLSLVRFRTGGHFDWAGSWDHLVEIIDNTIRGSDVIGREPRNNRLAFLFPETDQAGGEVAMERIRQLIHYEFLEQFSENDFTIESVSRAFPDTRQDSKQVTDQEAAALIEKTNQLFPAEDCRR